MSQAIMEARAKAIAEMETLSGFAAERSLTEDEASRFDALESEVKDLDTRSAQQAKASKLAAAAPASPVVQDADLRSVARPAGESQTVTAKAVPPYDVQNRSVSWFADRHTMTSPDASNAEVEEARGRLSAHYDAVNDEGSGRQVRTYSVGTNTEGGYLAAPQYMQSMFADLLAAGRPTADLVGKMALPDSGQTFYIPTQTGAAAVGVTTENATLTETTAAFGQIQLDAARIGGTATLPNWLVDRSFPGADQIVLRELAKQYALKVDDIVLNSTTSNRKGLLQETGLGAVTATAGTATIANLWPALVKAIQTVASGIYVYPDAVVMHPRRWGWLVGQMDTANRPVIGSLNPQNSVGTYSSIDPVGAFEGPQAVGTVLGIPVYLDATIPTNLGTGTDEDRIIVMKRDEPLLFESAPRFAVSMDAQFAKDQFVARVTGDLAFTCARRKGAVAIVSGTALNDVL